MDLSPIKILKTVTVEILGFMSHDVSGLPTFIFNLLSKQWYTSVH